jgi:cyclophilin family peptidyl-prolyl cis-trans isomerase
MISFHDIELIPVGIRSMIPQTNGSVKGTPFARVIKDFVIQGGALDGSGDEATSIFGGYFWRILLKDSHRNGSCISFNQTKLFIRAWRGQLK